MTDKPTSPEEDLATGSSAARALAALAPRKRGRKPDRAHGLAALRLRQARLTARLLRAQQLRAAQDVVLRALAGPPSSR